MLKIKVKNFNPNSNFYSLNLGSGPKRKNNYLGIDIIDFDSVDIVGDIFDCLKLFPDNSINNIYSSHFLEHITDLPKLMKEVERILVPGSNFEVIVPHFSNPFFYSDYTHKNFFGIYSFSYFCNDAINKRIVPKYNHNINLEIDSILLVFTSYRPYYLRHIFKKFFQFLFNINSYTREFYEENLVYIIPCYEIKFMLRKSL